ncbi:MAG: murein hydrolase activator EnvC family protein [Traorella sp.]
MRKGICFLLTLSLLLVSSLPVLSTDYSQNEDYWYDVCNGKISQDMLSKCQGFTEYLKQKAASMEANLDNIDAKIDEIRGDIDKLVALAAQIQEDIDVKDSEIKELEKQIDKLENNIKQLEIEIQTKEEDIETRDAQIKERMVQTQTFNQSNGYIDFIMGARDFVDLIRRLSVMNQITEYEQNQIELLNEDIKQLEHDKEEIEIQKESVEAQKDVVKKAKQELEEYKSRQTKLIAEYKQKEEDLMDTYMRSQASIESIKNNMPSYSVGSNQSVSSSGFGRVCTGYISAGTWYYPASFGGGRHSGMDIAGPIGTPVTSPINGIVTIAQNITSAGGLGVSPYTGNNVMIIGSVNGTTYAIHMLHLQYNSIKVKVGQVVNQGDVIAARGSTGNSSGPHVHIDLYNLGSMSVESAYNYVRNTGTYTFGMPYKAEGWECSNKSPVCKERPEEFIPV